MDGPKYVAPAKRLYRARHKVTRKDLWKSYTVDDLTLSVDEPALLDFSVPVLDFRKPPKKAVSSSERSSSIFSQPCGTGSEFGSQDDLDSTANGELQNLMFRNYSLDSMILQNKKRITDHEGNVSLLKAVSETPAVNNRKYATCSRPSSLPPKLSKEKALHENAIEELVRHAERLEHRDARALKYTNRKLLRREEFAQKQWAEIGQSGNKDILIEIRRRNLVLDGLPWQHRQRIYDLCLIKDLEAPPSTPLLAQLRSAIDSAVDGRGDEIFRNLYTRSKWLKNGAPPAFNFYQIFELEFESLYYHITISLGIDPVREFVWPLLATVLCHCLNHGPADMVVKLVDTLVLTSYYGEIDEMLDKIWEIVLKEQSHKFFGSRENVRDEIRSVDAHLPTLLQTLQAQSRQTEGVN
ncbi:LAQU0S26e00452g1_1 [Lachancea quebecensis]|uniref:LAQU0S26e00452g1_1 n=1 Tax=Lachancea quebecensis TaxID=1654605 RepID=A0A0P1L550_9SACH|nr:LAQU0S26e00452g1_1 [Lachancea quebecensis]